MLDEHLLDGDLRHAVLERVENVDQRLPHGELGHAVSRHLVRRDDAVGAGELEPADRFGPAGAGDQVEVRLERSGRKDDVHGALIGVDG